MIESVSRRAFSSSSGTYNVRASELARERKLNIFNVTVVFLDDTQQLFQIEKKAKGSVLLEQVFQNLELVEKDYFGLQFTENGLPPNATNTELTRWLDSGKSVKKQVGVNPHFWLAVRFYPPEPSRLAEEYTRYLLCLQLRKLLLDGRMIAPKNTALLLASFTVQAELGDYNATEHQNNYLSELCLLPKQSPEDERRIKELHKLHKGQSPADAEANFLEHAKRLDCYGVESHPAKDYNGKDILIGVTSIGIVVFQNNIRVNTFSWSKIVKISFKKKQFFIQLKREASESYDTVLGFNMRSSRASKALWRCSVERHGFFRLRAPRRKAFLGAWGALAGVTAPAVIRTETQALEDAKRSRSINRSFVRRSSSRNRDKSSGASPGVVSSARGSRVTGHDEPPPREAWGDELHNNEDDSDGGFLERVFRVPLTYVDDSESESVTERAEEDPAEGVVCVRLYPGTDGRYGFNVRGGGGGAAVLVSRVMPRTRAHLQEGDQVISINGTDVEEMTHEQVVQTIRNTKGVLTLMVKPNAVYEPEVCVEEPAVCFVPLGAGTFEGDLQQSMLLLGDGLASGAALRQYDALLRRAADRPATAARLPANLARNRYRDIAPYDSSRVILKNGPNGDYINASYINMEIANSDLVLTYIATQGPLASTVGDFWQMVWESESSLVVMLTVLAERGRAKCHQYWPKVGTALKATNSLTVVTNSEQNLGHYTQREMSLKDSNGASRDVTQLQYTAWPDHGVPDDHQQFISFVRLCSQLRNHRAVIPTVVEDMCGPERVLEPPMIVHCSAGVGRTGALILAETALELLGRKQPLYPLDLVRAMRTQRPMCIQNASQYKFVCESIQSAYAQGLTDEGGAN
ncbi:tyrosine-protein phosphatase non-receptor type 4 isoform X1 [Danaus plexippus]|uniref:tyrosine-protein phosphatase non-receptor type 4 isoform X1 n=2 Tax=Danaus plexippus TaxID=13037 RepID=UPI0013C4E667|nr:tyrosine-protein phosphatase non-receptor type 4 isoform X1 [Danaus plexippus plexippus]XP_061383655.1 tyrosine-protein phosphatase non-receptor type 4 isoform X1 [Danaus plexippus]